MIAVGRIFLSLFLFLYVINFSHAGYYEQLDTGELPDEYPPDIPKTPNILDSLVGKDLRQNPLLQGMISYYDGS